MFDLDPIDLADLARREEQRVAVGVSELADESIRVAGGIAARGPIGTWINCGYGLGLLDPCGDRAADEVARLVEWYASTGREPFVEICPYAERSVVRALADQGFRPARFETVFHRPIAPGESFRAPRPLGEGLSLAVLDPSDDAAVERFARAVSGAFAPPERSATAEEIELTMRWARHPRTATIMALHEGRCVGGGIVEFHRTLASLQGLAVEKAFRRRGIQQAIIAARLALARDRGATIATVSGPPGMPTERNVRRFGFQVAYTKVHVTRPAPGLVGAPLHA